MKRIRKNRAYSNVVFAKAIASIAFLGPDSYIKIPIGDNLSLQDLSSQIPSMVCDQDRGGKIITYQETLSKIHGG